MSMQRMLNASQLLREVGYSASEINSLLYSSLREYEHGAKSSCLASIRAAMLRFCK